MGVELQHAIIYGYEFDYDDLPDDDRERDRLLTRFDDHKADSGDFVLYSDGRGGEYCIAGIVIYLSKSTRWNGPQRIPIHRLDERPDPTLVEAMEQTVAEDFPMEPLHEAPAYIVFTNDW